MGRIKRTSFLVVFILGISSCGQPPASTAPANAVVNATTKPQLSTDCPLSFPLSNYCASLTWLNTPTFEGENSFTIHFWDAKSGSSHGPYSDPPHSVFTKLWMPSMGHGSSKITLARSADSSGVAIPGVFLGTDVYFTMPGAWDVHIQLKDGSKIVEEALDSLSL